MLCRVAAAPESEEELEQEEQEEEEVEAMAPGHRRRRARPNLPAILLVGVVLLFSAYHFTAASSHVSIDGATGRHRTAVSVASAASAEGHDAGGSGGVTSALIPLEGARTLQFDVCNGFTNQRIALMSGAC